MTSSWIEISDDSPFPIENLPFGVISRPDNGSKTLAVAVGAHVLDLARIADGGLLNDIDPRLPAALGTPTLNAFLALGRPTWDLTHDRITDLLSSAANETAVREALLPAASVTNLLPFDVADYVDFYSSEHHALNVSQIFRPESPQLPENWKHIPIGYHGRAGTVVVSGTPIARPSGQRKPRNADTPTFGPSERLDIEAEIGFVVGTPTELGSSVSPEAFRDHVFGVVLLNDWSARDIQAWEYVPLGPFLGKSFATSISPWVVPLSALEQARVPLAHQDPPVFDYLVDESPWCLDIALEVALNGTVVSQPPFTTQYWSPGQQLAHLTVNGASLRTGDLYASGTVTGPRKDQRGSLLELSWGGKEPITLDDGSERTFLQDGDIVAITGWAPGRDGRRIGFGSVEGFVTPGRGTDA
jgi:fumarylacetoacetase